MKDNRKIGKFALTFLFILMAWCVAIFVPALVMTIDAIFFAATGSTITGVPWTNDRIAVTILLVLAWIPNAFIAKQILDIDKRLGEQ